MAKRTSTKLTVGDLRKMLEGLCDHVLVRVWTPESVDAHDGKVLKQRPSELGRICSRDSEHLDVAFKPELTNLIVE